MSKFEFYLQDCTDEELKQTLEEAKEVARIVHNTVTVHTATEVYEVHDDEKEEKDVEKPKEKS